jgi:hypothetical protein
MVTLYTMRHGTDGKLGDMAKHIFFKLLVINTCKFIISHKYTYINHYFIRFELKFMLEIRWKRTVIGCATPGFGSLCDIQVPVPIFTSVKSHCHSYLVLFNIYWLYLLFSPRENKDNGDFLDHFLWKYFVTAFDQISQEPPYLKTAISGASIWLLNILTH